MSTAEGLRIISVAKSLEGFQRGDQNISRYFGATMLAGHAGMFLSSLRKQTRMPWRKFKALAAGAHIEMPILKTVLIPWMKTGGFIDYGTLTDDATIQCNVLDYNAVLDGTAALFRASDPSPEECAILGIVQLGINFPQLKSELLGKSRLGSEETLKTALELATDYKIVRTLSGEGIMEPITYSPLIWGENIGKIGRALSHLDKNRRETLTELVEMIRRYQPKVPRP
jgi:hypothetical protein